MSSSMYASTPYGKLCMYRGMYTQRKVRAANTPRDGVEGGAKGTTAAFDTT